MIKRYCDRCGQQIDEGVHAWYVLELHGTDGEFRHKELCEECYEYLCEKDEAPKADRKTNSSEKPNNSTISKMEQVDKDINVRSKDEPQNHSGEVTEMVEDEPITQTKTQNSNLTFEKRTMRDCYNCERYETEDECIECHYEPKDECAKEYEELGLKELKELIEADRKTNSSEIPNNCEAQTDGYMTAEQTEDYRKMLDKAEHKVYGNIEDEPQTERSACDTCIWYNSGIPCGVEPSVCKREIEDEPQIFICPIQNDYEALIEDEPQTQLTAKCLNCNNSKVCKEKHWDGCVYEPKDEKTCETCRHWKYIAHEWQCEACKCQGYEPKDEPQTDCAWMKGE